MHIRKQGGMTFISFVIVVGLVIFGAYLGMRIGPIYMEYFAVVTAMDQVAAERGSANRSAASIRQGVKNRLYVSYSTNVKDEHIKVTRADGGQLRVAYEVRKPLLGNLDIVARFDRSVTLSR